MRDSRILGGIFSAERSLANRNISPVWQPMTTKMLVAEVTVIMIITKDM